MPSEPDPIPRDWPEAAEDAAQFFLYRAQVGAAHLQVTLSAEEIRGMLAAPPDPDGLTAKLTAALAEAFRRDCAQAEAELRMAAAIGEPRDPPDLLWVRHRAAFLERPERSPLRLAAEQFEPVRPGWWSRLWGKLRGS
jgi:hypothetical protein